MIGIRSRPQRVDVQQIHQSLVILLRRHLDRRRRYGLAG
jgi:hypothetical protein